MALRLSLPRSLFPLTSSASGICRPCFISHQYLRSNTGLYFYNLRRISTRRQLQTATAHRPQTLSTEPPPPRNTGVPDGSITGGIPGVNDTRPPRMTGQHEAHLSNPSESSTRSLTAEQAQQLESAAQTYPPKPHQPDSVSSPAPQMQRKRQSKLRPRKAAMTLTPAATRQLKDLLSQPEPKLIRVGVKNRGCSGLAYHLEYVDKPGTFDETVEQDGVKVLIDSKALFV